MFWFFFFPPISLTPQQEARKKRFGANLTLDNRGKRASTLTPDELAAKKAQAERLGLPIKGTKLAGEIASTGKALTEDDERLKQRLARFASQAEGGGATGGAAAAASADPEEEERKRRRLEKFAPNK